VRYSVDAGGSRTTVAVQLPDRGDGVTGLDGDTATQSWTTDSFAIASVGEAEAEASLELLLTKIRTLADGVVAVGCIASSSMPVAGEAPAPASLIEVVRRHAPAGRVVVVNDVVPLVYSAAMDPGGIVISSGTGSSVLARDPRTSTLIKVGGHEHIVSDQGSAYSLAREGLRAAARDADGIGATTSLRPSAEEFFGRPLPALGRWLAELPRVRTAVASFAPYVTDAAADGDAVARAIAEAEAAALVDAAGVAVTRLSLGPTPAIAFAGSVLHNSDYFRNLVADEFARRGLTSESRENVRLLEGVAAHSIPDGIVLEITQPS
jgi:N-acetylglucosamine kinase-like BadF-type ATPase